MLRLTHPRKLAPLVAVLAALVVAVLTRGVLAQPVAAAAPEGALTVGVLGVDSVGAPEALAQGLTSALRQRAAAVPGVRLLTGGKDLVEVKLMFGCLDERAECLAKAGRSLGADRLVFGSLRKASGGYTVVVKQLDVSTGAIDRFVSETVPARALQREEELTALSQRVTRVLLGSALRGGLRVLSLPAGAEVRVDGQPVGQTPLVLTDLLASAHTVSLALPGYQGETRSLSLRGGAVTEITVALLRPGQTTGADVVAPTASAAPSAAARTGKALKVASFVLVGAAALSGGVAIYTWRGYQGDADTARGALDTLQQLSFPNASSEVNAFFASQERLSSCEVPPALMTQALSQPLSAAAYSSYMDACRHGRSFAGATTGLLATMGSLALLGVTTYIIGDRLSRRAEAEQKAGQARVLRPSYRPRLTELSPVVSAQGGGVNLSIRF